MEKVSLSDMKILGLFVKTLAAGRKYSLLNRENLKKPIQMQLSQKQKFISQFVAAILKSTLNFEHFQKKMTIIANVFPKLWTPKNLVKQVSKESRFKGPFDRQHDRVDQTLLKPEPKHFYHIY